MEPVKTATNDVKFSPLSFLNVIGTGGIAISFYMYLFWLVPSELAYVPHFWTLLNQLRRGNFLIKTVIVLGTICFALFAFEQIFLFIKNFKRFWAWRRTPSYGEFCKSEQLLQLSLVPLAVSVLALVVGLLILTVVPHAWRYHGHFLPLFQLVAIGCGGYSLFLCGLFSRRFFIETDTGVSLKSWPSQIFLVMSLCVSVLELSIIKVVTYNRLLIAMGYVTGEFFFLSALLIGGFVLIGGVRAFVQNKGEEESFSVLCALFPAISVCGLAYYLQHMAFSSGSYVTSFNTASIFFSLIFFQLALGVLVWPVFSRYKLVERYILGNEKALASFLLLIYGAALVVLFGFFISKGLVPCGVFRRSSWGCFGCYALVFVFQIYLVRFFFKLNPQILGRVRTRQPAPKNKGR